MSITRTSGATGSEAVPVITATEHEVRAGVAEALLRRVETELGAIRIVAHGGDVWLGGEIASVEDLRLVESAAWSTPGVRRVINDLVVVPRG